MIKKYFKLNKGFTLVETLVAVSIFSMSLLGLMSVLASNITNTTYAKEKIIGAYLAQEGIEYVRNMRDTFVLTSVNSSSTGQAGWDSFKIKLAQCIPDNGCGITKPLPLDVFVCTSPNLCKLYLNNGGYDNVSTGTDSGFVRRVWMTTYADPNQVKIFSSVSWTQGSGSSSVIFSEDLFNWVE